MKDFLATFLIVLIFCYFFLFFGGVIVLENIFAGLVFVALVISILITLYIRQETKIEELEARIKNLETKSEAKEANGDF
ncbi:MAG: hypothetical protein WBJ82_06590 [Tepidanaerobacteraceae bacterium]|jgi:uncharacterized membrane protein YciS (DUF1049 family)|nr:hypothetical protein [Tepidanaerobacter sp.]HQA59858.1 hypothetical protein [Tepidanaerobacteraceae bacterium]HQE05498.1 hypothetical protein [Tepidanaerobacteraceae bacterium]